ncbi:MAG TPA: NAD(P)/FAD-dependent oxidoreductase, partial [Gemmatimonadales bacterium]|nr:NAD(P)/FAD-dependent oxidoreductase [Gemmatimonadales bacterium]
GQLIALYPEKYIFDVAGFPKVLSKDLVKGLAEQGLQFKSPVHLGEKVIGLREDGTAGAPRFTVVTDRDEYPSHSVLIAAGIGAFTPRKLPLKDADHWVGRGLHDRVLDPQVFRGKRILIVGGGDSAFDWAVNLQGIATSILMIHRRDGFRAHQATVAQVQRLCDEGKMALRTFWELRAIGGNDAIEQVTIFNNKTKEEETLPMDCVIPQLGFVSALGAIAEWGLDIEKGDIRVAQTMETNRAGIFAAGDIVTYPGKLKLIATGVAEACIAVNHAVHFVNPAAKVDPGHSSNMAMFGQTPD